MSALLINITGSDSEYKLHNHRRTDKVSKLTEAILDFWSVILALKYGKCHTLLTDL